VTDSSTSRVDFIVPDGVAAGTATFTITAGGDTRNVTGAVQAVAPALFTADESGTGVAAATAVVVSTTNPEVETAVPVYSCDETACSAVPIALPDDAEVLLTLNATGIRKVTLLDAVTVLVNGISIPVVSAGPTETAGLDQVTARLIKELRGTGEANIVIIAEGQVSNVATITLQ
jgi:uncharacterized protein (TIGR03437 family)